MRVIVPFILVVLAAAAVVWGDVVELNTGERIECRIVGGTGDFVYIRRAGGSAKAVEKIDRSAVLRIDRDNTDHNSISRGIGTAGGESTSADTGGQATRGTRATTTSTANAPAASAPAVEISPQTQRALAMAIAKWRGEDFKEAGIDLARLINTATPDQREAMSEQVRTFAGMSLAELATDVRWRAAMAARRGSGIRLEYVTDYEKPVLIARMTAAYEAALRERGQADIVGRSGSEVVAAPRQKVMDRNPVGPNDRLESGPTKGDKATTRPWYEALPQASQPAGLDPRGVGADYALIDLLVQPERFNGSTAQAKVLAGRTAYAMSILNERLRLDPELNRNTKLKRIILLDKKRLAALYKVLSARIAHPNRSAPDPQAAKAEQARKEELRKNWEQQQKARAEEVQKAREEARKWQDEQDRQPERKPGLFDWLKPKPADEKK